MKKPIDSNDNFKKCICGDCAKYINRVCMRDVFEPTEKLYCARNVTSCKLGEGVCICPGCSVYKENGLAGAVFCIKRIVPEGAENV